MNWNKFSKVIEYPKHLPQPSYLTVMGSQAYGLATPESDWDFYGCVVPPKDVVFPHLAGNIAGFGRQVQKFEQAQKQHVQTEYGETDSTVYNIVKYFQLLMEGNPNIIESVFTPEGCVVMLDSVGSMIRENRHLFLSQKCWHTFRGMGHSHLSRLENRTRIGKRKENVEKYGYDTKDAATVIRLTLELSQVLLQGTLDMQLPATMAVVKDIRAGNWKLEHVREGFEEMVAYIEKQSSRYVVPYKPDEEAIKQVLINCLEEKYGNLSKLGFRNPQENIWDGEKVK